MPKKAKQKPFVAAVCDCCEVGGLMVNTKGVYWCLDCLKQSLGWRQLSDQDREVVTAAYDLYLRDPVTAALVEKIKNLSPQLRHDIALGRSRRRLHESVMRGEQ